MGKNSSFIQVPFLNLMATLASRSGEVHIRVGGNTQDYASLVDSLPQGNIIEKVSIDANSPTSTPTLLFTPDLLYLMNNISSFVPVKWYLGEHLFPNLFPPAHTVPRRRSAQRYIKLAIADRHSGREYSW